MLVVGGGDAASVREPNGEETGNENRKGNRRREQRKGQEMEECLVVIASGACWRRETSSKTTRSRSKRWEECLVSLVGW